MVAGDLRLCDGTHLHLFQNAAVRRLLATAAHLFRDSGLLHYPEDTENNGKAQIRIGRFPQNATLISISFYLQHALIPTTPPSTESQESIRMHYRIWDI